LSVSHSQPGKSSSAPDLAGFLCFFCSFVNVLDSLFSAGSTAKLKLKKTG
jgi:hypothetical protein